MHLSMKSLLFSRLKRSHAPAAIFFLLVSPFVWAQSNYECANSDPQTANDVQQCYQSTTTTGTSPPATSYLCPIQEQACTQTTNGYQCPAGAQYACMPDATGQQMCSPNPCVDINGSGVSTTPVTNDPTPTSNAPTDPSTGACLGTLRIFPGRDATCRGNGMQTAWQNCCKAGSMTDTVTGPKYQENQKTALENGLSKAIPIYPQCKTQETQTGFEVNSGYCHYVGDYCGEHIPLIGCVQQVHAYCCYSSMISELIQEAAHQQIPAIGGWGSASSPNCAGLTTQQFQAVDFSKIDFSGYQTELTHNTQPQIQSELNTSAVPQ